MRALLLLALLAPAALADHHEMDAVAWLAGDWKGEGWIMTGPGQRREFHGVEAVERRLDGQVMLVEGRHFAKDDAATPIHNALALISYDSDQKMYRFQAHAVGRPPLDASAVVDDGVFIWTMDTPGGAIRYRIRRTEEGDWHETGERSVGPDQWAPFFEMTMKRVH